MDKASEVINVAINGSHDDEVDPTDNMTEDEAAMEKLKAGDGDLNKIKFTTVNVMDGKNGDAKVDISLAQTSVGMSKEELMKFANDPFWVKLRMFLFVLFWLAWIAMLVGAVVIILLAPRCPPPPHLHWFQKTAMYQVDVVNFKDGDGDGVGDIKGLISKLDYFKDINVKTLLLNAIYAFAPNTNHIVNYTDIDSRFGTMSDFDDLVAQIQGRDMKLVLDFIPNHTSDEHPWFIASEKKEEPYKDYYIWVDSASSLDPPNNWLSVDGGSCWEWSGTRKGFYLHTYSKNEPDLNLNNEAVRQEINNAMVFWLNKNVDGFKILSASHLIEDSAFRDEPLLTDTAIKNPNYNQRSHVYTVDQPENMDLFSEWRLLLNDYDNSTDIPKVLMAELSGELNDSLRYYGNGSHQIVDFPIHTKLTELNVHSNATELQQCLEFWTDSIPKNSWPEWLLGSKNTKRLAERVGSDLLDGFHMAVMLAQGTPITYYGDELGMMDVSQKDHHPMHEVQSVMQWRNDNTLGFTNKTDASISKPENYQIANVEVQKEDKKSHMKIFSHLVALRNQPAINFGFQKYPYMTDKIFSMMRVRKGSPGYLVVMNMSPNSTVVDLSDKDPHLPETGRVEIRSRNIDSGPLNEGEHPKIRLENIALGPKQSVVFSFVPKFDD